MKIQKITVIITLKGGVKMKNKKTKLLIGLLSMSVICMAGKSVNANRINWNDPVQKAQYYKEYYQKNRGLILPKKKNTIKNTERK